MTMSHTVVSVEQDMAGKWYARVVTAVDENGEPIETQFFKFDLEPTDAEIQAAVNDWLAARQQEVDNGAAQ